MEGKPSKPIKLKRKNIENPSRFAGLGFQQLETMLGPIDIEVARLSVLLKSEDALTPQDQTRFELLAKQKRELEEAIERLTKK